MKRTITGLFNTRREAEMAVEHLTQEHGFDRSRVRTHAAGEENTSGTVLSGADAAAVAEGETPEGVRHGRVAVLMEADDAEVERVSHAFRDCGVACIEPQSTT